jgi:hypothetical protein
MIEKMPFWLNLSKHEHLDPIDHDRKNAFPAQSMHLKAWFLHNAHPLLSPTPNQSASKVPPCPATLPVPSNQPFYNSPSKLDVPENEQAQNLKEEGSGNNVT